MGFVLGDVMQATGALHAVMGTQNNIVLQHCDVMGHLIKVIRGRNVYSMFSRLELLW